MAQFEPGRAMIFCSPGTRNMISGIAASAQWVNQFRDDGVYFPITVLTDRETTDFRTELGNFERGFERRFERTPRGADLGQCHLHFEWARRLAMHPRILDIAEAVLGRDILVHATTIFNKRPHSGSYVSWHQDGYHMRLDRPDFLSVWVALSDSNRENGCLRVVPGSHRNGRAPHGENADTERNLLTSGLEISTAVDERDAIDVVLRAGEASLHHVDIVHGSNANNSADYRTGFAIRFVAPHVHQVGLHHSVILARGSNRFGGYRLHTDSPVPDFETALENHARFASQLVADRHAAGRKT